MNQAQTKTKPKKNKPGPKDWIKDITLADKQWGPESRVVFAGTTSLPFVNMMILGGCRRLLFSYWYLKEAEKRNETGRIFRGVLKRGTGLFIDSGVFTYFKKMKMPGINGKIYENPPEVMKKIRAEGDKRFDEFFEFTKAYVKFLNRWDRYITVAFDMDIDMFASVESADKLYHYIYKHYKSPEKIMRVWHHSRPFSVWQQWCDEGTHKYLSVEGAGTHGRDIDYYRRFVDYAHARGIKVHVLATTSPEFLHHVNCDSADSSTWSVGGRFGSVYSPVGILNFGRSTEQNQKQWDKLSIGQQKRFMAWLEEVGLGSLTPAILKSETTWGVAARNIANIAYFRRMGNRPVDEETDAVRRKSILDVDGFMSSPKDSGRNGNRPSKRR